MSVLAILLLLLLKVCVKGDLLCEAEGCGLRTFLFLPVCTVLRVACMLSCFPPPPIFPPLPAVPCYGTEDGVNEAADTGYEINGIDEVSVSPANGGPVSVRRFINYAANGSPIISVVHQLYTYALVLLFTSSLAIPLISSSVKPRQLLPLISATMYCERTFLTFSKSFFLLLLLLALLL